MIGIGEFKPNCSGCVGCSRNLAHIKWQHYAPECSPPKDGNSGGIDETLVLNIPKASVSFPVLSERIKHDVKGVVTVDRNPGDSVVARAMTRSTPSKNNI